MEDSQTGENCSSQGVKEQRQKQDKTMLTVHKQLYNFAKKCHQNPQSQNYLLL